jgi:hypothetical protein
MKAFKAYNWKRKKIYSFKSAKNDWVRKSQICKLQNIFGLQIANAQIATFAEGPQI